MKQLIERVASLGIGNESNIIERRRIAMLNIFSLIIVIILVLLGMINLVIAPSAHALWIIACVILIAPTYYFTYSQKHQLSRTYFIGITLLIINALGYSSMFNFNNRHNEIYFIGCSSIIIILLDNPQKWIFFCVAIISSITMYFVRWDYLETGFNSDSLISIINVVIAFVTIYLTTSIFKSDLVKSLGKIQEYTIKLEEQQSEVMAKHKDLTSSRQLLRTLLDNLPILIALMDVKGNYVIVNQTYQEFFNLKLKDIEGKNSKEILGEELHEKRKPLMERCLAGQESILNATLKLPQDKVMDAYGKYVPLFDDQKNVTGILVYVTDVSKLKKVEGELLQLNATKDKLLSIISHDLKTPLNSLKSLLQVADSLEPHDLKELMKTIQAQVDTVSFTMENLLNWVHTQLEGFKSAPQLINLPEIAGHSLQLYQEQISSKKIGIIIENDTSGVIYADKDNMSLVCRNLISNAVKFTPQNGQITLSCKKLADTTVVSVIDTGIGMSKDHIDMIMNDERRNIVRKGTSGEKGTGLGLSFCKDILALNNAKMEIYSEETRGTEMRIIFANQKS